MNRRLVVASLAALAVAAIICMPLRTIVAVDGVTARKVDGIIWDGSIRDLRLGKLPVGDVNARLLFSPLFMGKAEILLSRGNSPFVPGINGVCIPRFQRCVGQQSDRNLSSWRAVCAVSGRKYPV